MRDLFFTVLYIGSAIFVALLILVAVIFNSIPRCDNPNNMVVALELDTSTKTYQLGTCQDGIVDYEDIDFFEVFMKLKEK